MEDQKPLAAPPATDVPERDPNWAERLVAPLMWMQWKPPPGVDKHDPENNSGTGGPVPPEIARKRWCWGALGLGPIWSAYNGLPWLAPLQLIPVLAFVITAYLFYAGHGLAWQNRRFRSREQYFKTMRVWNIAGMIAFPLWVAMQVSLYKLHTGR